MALVVALTIALSTSSISARRSVGYAGSLPDGQLTGAIGSGDCRQLQGAPKLAHLMVPFLDDCAMIVPSPNARFSLQKQSGEAALNIFEGRKLRLTIPMTQPAAIMWSPRSNAFFVNDGQGSGQTSRLRYFSVSGWSWLESREFDQAAERYFIKRQKCRSGAYANVSGVGWTSGGIIRAVIQEGVHSAGCLQPADGNIALIVNGDAPSGTIHVERIRVDR